MTTTVSRRDTTSRAWLVEHAHALPVVVDDHATGDAHAQVLAEIETP